LSCAVQIILHCIVLYIKVFYYDLLKSWHLHSPVMYRVTTRTRWSFTFLRGTGLRTSGSDASSTTRSSAVRPSHVCLVVVHASSVAVPHFGKSFFVVFDLILLCTYGVFDILSPAERQCTFVLLLGNTFVDIRSPSNNAEIVLVRNKIAIQLHQHRTTTTIGFLSTVSANESEN